MSYTEITGRIREIDAYKSAAKAINSVGIQKLKTFCEGKAHPVKNFDRDIEIVKHMLKYGPTSCVTRFDVSKQRAIQILRKYEKYAKEAACWQDG